MILIGAYITWWLHTATGDRSVPDAAGLGRARCSCSATALQRLLLERVIRASLFMTLVLTFGLNMVLVNVLLALFSADVRSITMPYASEALEIGGIRLPWTRLAVFALALALTVGAAPVHDPLAHRQRDPRDRAERARRGRRSGIDRGASTRSPSASAPRWPGPPDR